MGDRWKINFVYPVNMAAIYTINETWSVSIVGKIWNTRHRVNKNEALPKAILDYRNNGVEVGLNYACGKFLTANVHVGSTLGDGNLQVLNHNGDNIRYNNFKASPYLGGSLSVKF